LLGARQPISVHQYQFLLGRLQWIKLIFQYRLLFLSFPYLFSLKPTSSSSLIYSKEVIIDFISYCPSLNLIYFPNFVRWLLTISALKLIVLCLNGSLIVIIANITTSSFSLIRSISITFSDKLK